MVIFVPRNPSFSIIVPLFNKQKYIARAIQSTLDQSWADWELLVIDDGSTDSSPDIVGRFLSDNRVRLITQKNAGEGGARNRGLAEMRGEIAVFLDADDEWLPWHLADIAALSAEFPQAGLLATGYRQMYWAHATEHSINRRTPALVTNYFNLARTGYAIHISSCALRRQIVAAGITFRERAPMGADVEFYARVGIVSALAYHPRVSAIYHRYVEGSVMSESTWKKDLPILHHTLLKYLMNTANLGKACREAVSRYLEWLLVQHTLAGIAAGQKTDALSILRDAAVYPITDLGKLRLRRLSRFFFYTPLPIARHIIKFRRSRWWLPVQELLQSRATAEPDPDPIISTISGCRPHKTPTANAA
jgi:glycosyltransferase involved in cell wall biosynthesis